MQPHGFSQPCKHGNGFFCVECAREWNAPCLACLHIHTGNHGECERCEKIGRSCTMKDSVDASPDDCAGIGFDKVGIECPTGEKRAMFKAAWTFGLFARNYADATYSDEYEVMSPPSVREGWLRAAREEWKKWKKAVKEQEDAYQRLKDWKQEG